jgi:hypothetical protein
MVSLVYLSPHPGPCYSQTFLKHLFQIVNPFGIGEEHIGVDFLHVIDVWIS